MIELDFQSGLMEKVLDDGRATLRHDELQGAGFRRSTAFNVTRQLGYETLAPQLVVELPG